MESYGGKMKTYSTAKTESKFRKVNCETDNLKKVKKVEKSP